MPPTQPMTVRATLTFTGSDTQVTPWIPVRGYTKMSVSGKTTGTATASGGVVIQATDVPPSPNLNYQPDPEAEDIDTLETLTNVVLSGTASTVGARDEYDNVLPLWVRAQVEETAGNTGTVELTFVFKSAS